MTLRFHMNSQFHAEKAKLTTCVKAADHECNMLEHPTHPADAESLQVAQDNLDVAIAKFVAVPAYNGFEILLQLEAMLSHTDEWMANGGAFERSLTAAARPQPSPTMERAFAVFRKAWLDQADYEGSDNTEERRLCNSVCHAATVVFEVPCATAGDFLVKAYINVLWHAGPTTGSYLRHGDSGNFFDVDLPEIETDSVIGDTYYRSVYDDLDHCDLGACLLATGHIDFDPKGWVERASAIGMPLAVIIKGDGSKSLSFGFIDADDDRLRREERRLQQILTFDHARRCRTLTAYIAENRPDLVLAAAAEATQAAA